MYEIMLDVQKGGFQAVLEGFRVGDANARELCVRLCEGRRPYRLPVKLNGEGKIVPDYIATLYIRGRSAVHYSACTEYADHIEHVFLSDEIEAGVSECEIKIIGGGKILTSAKFKIVATDVLQDDSAIEAENTFSALSEALERVLGAEGSVEEAVNAAETAVSAAEDAKAAAERAETAADAALTTAGEAVAAVEGKADKSELELKADKAELGDKIRAVPKAEEMTAEVGIDGDGKLWFNPRAWEELAITSFSVTPSGFVEKGATVEDITVSWKANKADATAELSLLWDVWTADCISGRFDPEDGAAEKTYTFEGVNVPYDKNQNLRVVLAIYQKGGKRLLRSKAIEYANRIYMGAAVLPGNIGSSFILSLSESKLSLTKDMTATVNADGSKYIWYACPESMGQPKFYAGGIEGGFECEAEGFPFTNSHGYTENYQIWRSVRQGLGVTEAEVR